MVKPQQALNEQQPIVDLNTGRASDYFKRVIFDRGIGLDTTKEDVLALQQTEVQGGVGIDGGGALGDGNITLDANVQEILDLVGTTQGAILYRNATDWVTLPPGTSGYVLTTLGPAANPAWQAVSSTGTVTSVSVVSANGFAGSVANPSTTPAITITTTITGVLKGNGTAVSAASAGTDYHYPAPPSTQSGTSYTAVLGDAGGYIQFTNAAAVAFTIPPNASVAFPLGTVITIEQNGAGTVTFTAGAGVSLQSRASAAATAGQYAVAQAKKVATNTWTLIGDLT